MIASRTPWRGLATAAALLLALAGCGGKTEVGVLTCPKVFVVADASRYLDYAPGAGRDMLDLRYDAQIVNVEWLCNFFVEEKRVETEVRFGMRAQKGPAGTESQHRFPYFVAVADPQGNIIAKQVFGVDIGFLGNATDIGHIESVYHRFNYSSIADAARYTIYIGFQLTQEQLAEVRAGDAGL